MKKILLLSMLGLLSTAFAADEQKKEVRLFSINQSYSTPYGFVISFAKSRGHKLDFENVGCAGAAIRWFWHNREKNKPQLCPPIPLQKNAYDYVNFTPLGPEIDTGAESLEGLAAYYGMARKQNQNVIGYVSNRWPHQGDLEDREGWMAKCMPQFEALADAGVKAHGGRVDVIPRAQAMMELLDRTRAGQIPGFVGRSRVYDDGGHPSTESGYMFATMEYGYLFGESPIGLPETAPLAGRNTFSLTPEQAESLQRIGWYHMLNYPRSGVKKPEDSTAPGKVLGLTLKPFGSTAVELHWQRAQDPESDIHCYRIERNDGRIFETLLPYYRDTEVEEQKAYSYTVSALNMLDMQGPKSDAAELKMPQDNSAPELLGAEAVQTASTVILRFNEPVAPADAGAFAVDGLQVKSARIAPNPKSITLTTSPMKSGVDYKVTVKGVADKSAAGNRFSQATVNFLFTPPVWQEWDQDAAEKTNIALKDHSLLITTAGKQPTYRGGGGVAGVYREMDGDFDYTVAVTSQAKSMLAQKHAERPGRNPAPKDNELPKTGILLTDDVARMDHKDRKQRCGLAVLSVLPDGRVVFEVNVIYLETFRSSVGKKFTSEPLPDGVAKFPCWLRLIRKGTLLRAFYSYTGVKASDWIEVASINCPRIAEAQHLMLFNSSGSPKDLNTGMFDLRGNEEAKVYYK